MSLAAESSPVVSATGSWRVMIVEDNPAVAALHRRLVDSVPSMKTAHVAFNGNHAFRALEAVRPDLVILDLTMPAGDGITFLRHIRRADASLDVIVVTASREGETVNQVMRLGVVDYLVKPFEPQRLRQALTAFLMRQRTLSGHAQLSQAEVDAVQGSGSMLKRRRLPKGLKESTLRSVLSALQGVSASMSAEEVGERAGVARVTARRYLEYLTVMGLVEMTRETKGPGRPRNRYRRQAPRRPSPAAASKP
jgi:response regulator of citrate/malate metabolism